MKKVKSSHRMANLAVAGFVRKDDGDFLEEEIKEVMEIFPKLNKDKFHNSLKGCTCSSIGSELITYPWDIVMALICGLEDRDLTYEEWD